MKVTEYFDLLIRHGSLKKSFTLILIKNGFFRHVTYPISGRQLFFRKAVAGSPVDLTVCNLQSMPVTVFLSGLILKRGGRSLCEVQLALFQHRVGRLPFQCHFVKEYIVTITDKYKRIQDLADQAIHFVDSQNYRKAHSALDDIEKKVREAHRHIDNLQNVNDFAARSPGD